VAGPGLREQGAEALLASLRRRLGAVHRLWAAAAADLTVEQVNHHERPGVLPIAFSLYHTVCGEDGAIGRMVLRDETRIWERDGWAALVGVEVDHVPRGTPIDEAERVRLRDLDAWRAYQRAVFERTEAALAALDPARLDEPLFGGAYPDSVKGGFLDLMLGGVGPIRLVDGLESFVYQHAVRHLGEVEHARALVGLKGLS
jgi:hypothetical protein